MSRSSRRSRGCKGRVVPITDNLVTFPVKGPADLSASETEIRAVTNPILANREEHSAACVWRWYSPARLPVVWPSRRPLRIDRGRSDVSPRAVKLRPQVSSWERSVPSGEGITGLWRPIGKRRDISARITDGIGRAGTLFSACAARQRRDRRSGRDRRRWCIRGCSGRSDRGRED